MRSYSAGALAARAAVTDIVDACVVEGALRRRDLVVSSDPGDLHAIAAATSRRLEIDHPSGQLHEARSCAFPVSLGLSRPG